MARKRAEVRVQGSVVVSVGDKSFSVNGNSLVVTNEYGNSAEYEIGAHNFEALWSQLWQFVRDSQH